MPNWNLTKKARKDILKGKAGYITYVGGTNEKGLATIRVNALRFRFHNRTVYCEAMVDGVVVAEWEFTGVDLGASELLTVNGLDLRIPMTLGS